MMGRDGRRRARADVARGRSMSAAPMQPDLGAHIGHALGPVWRTAAEKRHRGFSSLTAGGGDNASIQAATAALGIRLAHDPIVQQGHRRKGQPGP